MPTSNPRISVTLTPAVAAVLRELASLTGESQSSTVAGLLEMSVPVFERVVAALKAASVIKKEAAGEIAAGLERAQNKLEDQLQIQFAEMDTAFKPILDEAEKVHRRGRSVQPVRAAAAAPAAPKRAQDPRASNRGVRSPKTGQEGTAKGARRGRV